MALFQTYYFLLETTPTCKLQVSAVFKDKGWYVKQTLLQVVKGGKCILIFCNAGQVATALVREFLTFFELDYTRSVFDPETNAVSFQFLILNSS